MIPAGESCRNIFHVEHLEALGLEDYETGAIAAGLSCSICMRRRKIHWNT